MEHVSVTKHAYATKDTLVLNVLHSHVLASPHQMALHVVEMELASNTTHALAEKDTVDPDVQTLHVLEKHLQMHAMEMELV